MTQEGQQEEPRPRGRAAAEIRTGLFIRDFLARVGEASISDIHQALKSEIGKRNLVRPRRRQLRGPVYSSFVRYFGHVRRLGLVEFVREEDVEEIEPDVARRLMSIRGGPPPEEAWVVQTRRRLYRLSAAGRSAVTEILWSDPLGRGLLRQMLAGQLEALTAGASS